MAGASKTKITSENVSIVWELHDIIGEVHFGTLVLTLHCYSKYGLLSKHLFQWN